MLVNAAAADIAAPGKHHFRTFILPQERTQEIIRSPDLFASITFHRHIVDITPVDHHSVAADPLHHHADASHGIQHHINITHIRYIIYIYGLVRHGGRSENRKCRIFGACYLHIAHQRIPAFNCILFHSIILCFKVKVSILFSTKAMLPHFPSFVNRTHILFPLRLFLGFGVSSDISADPPGCR